MSAVARRTSAACLTRSLALNWMLARHGYAAQLRIGVRQAGAAVDAHAWIEYGGAVLADGGCSTSAYMPLESPRSEARPIAAS